MKRFIALLIIIAAALLSCDSGEVAVIQTTADTTQAVEILPVKEPEVKTLTFVGAGDNIIYYGNVRDAQRNAADTDRKYDFLPSYSDVADMISSADIAFINQETVMAHQYDLSYYPRFNSPRQAGLDLVTLGFDVVNIATNHMLDMGASGLESTIEFWNTQDLLTIGGYLDEDDRANIRVLEKDGIKIAFLAYTYSTNGLTKKASSAISIPYIDEETIKREIENAHDIADLVFVSMHWGNENNFTPSEEQKNLAAVIAAAGADAVIGHHPHVLQPIEWIEKPDGGKMLCVYSLGNFMAEMASDINMVGGMITFDITKVGDSRPVIENPIFVPTVFDHTASFYNNHIYKMENYTEEQAAKHGISYYGKKTSLEKLRGYVTDTIAAEFLPEYMTR